MDPRLRPLYGRTAARVSIAERMPVGAALHVELEKITSEPMDAATAVRVQALWIKLESHVAARKMIAVADVVFGVRDQLLQPSTVDEAEMLAAQEIACASRIPYATARNQIALVHRVGQCLPTGWVALDRGELSLAHLKAVEHETRHCTPALTESVDAQVIARAVERRWTPPETGKAARKLVLALDPKGAAHRSAAAKDAADVRLYGEPDGVSTLVANGDAARNRAVMERVNERAASMGRTGDHRPVGLRRFDALYDLVHGRTEGDTKPARPDVLVTVELSTLLGLNERPGELAGYGPITADAARLIAADATLRRLVTDPLTGDVIDLGLRSYRPSAALRRAMQAKHPLCTMPGCARPARDCDADHRHERQDGGRTDLANLKPLCEMHHQLKTKKRWKVDQHPDGSETWTSYLGFTYTKRPSHFPPPDPPTTDDDPPADLADRLPETFDPDPPRPDDPLPQPPPLTEEQYEEMERALDVLDAFDISFREWCDKYYDEARATGLVG